MKLLLDEMYSPSVAEVLRGRAVDTIAVTERDDLQGLSDTDLLQGAMLEGRVVVTNLLHGGLNGQFDCVLPKSRQTLA